MWHDSNYDPPEIEDDELEPKFNPATEGEIDLALEDTDVEIHIADAIFNPITEESAEPADNDKDVN